MKKRTLVLLVSAICVVSVAASVAVGAAAEKTARENLHNYRNRIERKIGRKYEKKANAREHTDDFRRALPDKTDLITEDVAKAKALTRAELTADDVKYIKAELDLEKGAWEYEVEFKHEGFEYEVDVNAKTGEIIKFEKEFDD